MTEANSKPIFLVSSAAQRFDSITVNPGCPSQYRDSTTRLYFSFSLSISLQLWRFEKTKTTFASWLKIFLKFPPSNNGRSTMPLTRCWRTSWERNFRGIYKYVHVKYMMAQGKPRWGNKSPRNGFWLDEIKTLFSDVKNCSFGSRWP